MADAAGEKGKATGDEASPPTDAPARPPPSLGDEEPAVAEEAGFGGPGAEEAEEDDGLHMPGVLPESEVVEAEGEELTAAEREVLRDLEEALGEEDRAGAEAPAQAAGPETPQAAAQAVEEEAARVARRAGPSPAALLVVGAMLLAAAVLATSVSYPLRAGFLVAGLAVLLLASKARRARAAQAAA